MQPTRRGLQMIAAATLLMLVASACGSDEPATAPEGGLEPGATLYAENCAVCHGIDLRGTKLGPSHLSIVYEPNHHPDESFVAAIEYGTPRHHWNFGDMPPVPGLVPEEMDAIIAYVRSEQVKQGFEQ